MRESSYHEQSSIMCALGWMRITSWDCGGSDVDDKLIASDVDGQFGLVNSFACRRTSCNIRATPPFFGPANVSLLLNFPPYCQVVKPAIISLKRVVGLPLVNGLGALIGRFE